MTKKEIKITYTEFDDIAQMSAEDQVLVKEAIKATEGSYAPYSNFHVGAAVRLSDGTIVRGANQENNAYPSGLCAERTAMFYANYSHPDQHMESLAIAASQNGELCSKPISPCGACRQVMAEYQRKGGNPISIILYGSSSIMKFDSVEALLPYIFDAI